LGLHDKRLLRISTTGQILSDLATDAFPTGQIVVGENSGLYVFLEDHDSKAGYLMSTDTALSKIRWQQKAERAWSSERPRLWKDLVLVANCRGVLAAIRQSDGAMAWSDQLKGCIRSIGTDDRSENIYIGAQEGTVYAYSPPR
jgi:hypothetical protein